MCFGVCITRRGMVYFGASIHIFVTLILFVGSTVRAFRKSTQLRDENRKEMLGAIIIATYFFILLMLGCLIFRATEQKNSKLLGWTSGVFITLETFAFVFNLLLLSPMGTAYDDYAFRNFGFTVDIFHIILSCVFLAFLLAYCATIVGYISKLKEARDGHHSSDFYDPDYEGDDGRGGGGGGHSEGPSRTSSRCPSTYFNQRSTMDDKPKLGSLMEVVREAKRAQMQQEQQQHQPKRTAQPSHSQQHSQQSSQGSQVVQPIQPQQQQNRSLPILKSDVAVPGAPNTTPSLSSSDIQVKVAETQTPPLPPAMPILHPHSQTLPHPHFYQRRGQNQSSNHFHDFNLSRGPRSSPSYPNVVTASVIPNRFRNPNSGLRTNAAGTLGRYDSLQSSGSPHSGSSRTQTLLRQNSSSLSSMDHPPIYDPDGQWEQPRIQALKYNYGYNALRRGTHRSDYGMEV